MTLPSAVGQALLAVGDQWTLLILQRALLGRARRFADWRDDLHIAESVLASRLKEMIARDLLVPKSYTANGRTRPEYMLSPRAIDLWPMFVAIWSWERARRERRDRRATGVAVAGANGIGNRRGRAARRGTASERCSIEPHE